MIKKPVDADKGSLVRCVVHSLTFLTSHAVIAFVGLET